MTFESLVYNAMNAFSKTMNRVKMWNASSVSDVFLVSQVLAVISASWTNNLTKMMFKAGIHGSIIYDPRTSGMDSEIVREFGKLTRSLVCRSLVKGLARFFRDVFLYIDNHSHK